MNLQWEGNWNKIKGKLKEKYGQLTDDDLTILDGQKDNALGKLQNKLGKTKAELETEIDSILKSY